ncbi:hypothetical protein [Roseovarius sp. M141]|uniref:hypothetical protein n=1 Tax=Roseovarius sp. M141 TaxID=2583806 RepID=UPI0020CFE3DB|nr:hypothetical protein [Roseovarius sp. M141]MCQ0090413.1 hypothetical protein [Roseovarius sp. M141]
MSVDGGQIPALAQKASASFVGVGLVIAIFPVRLLAPEEASVAIAVLTLALIDSACIGFGACRAVPESACSTAGICGSCRLGLPAEEQGIWHVDAETVISVLRRFGSARRCISLRSLSSVRCV